ncbi:MAG: endonuclease [Candidatus Marinimicrobia bacterium]|nr:endonuclease [Candidatus Neomarinimicrobiota bacterium]
MFTKNLKSRTPAHLYVLVLIFFTVAIQAQAPTGYYDPAAGKTGAALKAALHDIIKDHVEFPYTSSSTDVWDILKETDRDPANPDNVIMLYTGWSINGAAEYNNGNGWSREHVWAKSHGDFGETPPAGTDAHHLRPADITVNSARGNKDFDNGGSRYIDGDGVTDCYTDSDSWEPRNAVKGDVARMLFYMAVRYEGGTREPDLEVVDYVTNWNVSPAPKYPIHGKLSTLLEWHEQDPVNNWERNRNDIIYTKYQHNRNPFIDRPEFVAWIWSDTTGPGEIANLFFSEYIEGSVYNKALEIVNASAVAIDLSDYSIISNANNGVWNTSHYNFPAGTVLGPGDVWVIAHSAADSTIRNIANDTTRASVVNFSGNDVRALVKILEGDTTFLDVIGLYNDPDSSAAWTVAGISYATKDHTLLRKSSVRHGNPNWNISAGTNADDSEWIVFDSNTFDYLGSHTITPSSLFGLCNAPDRLDNYRLHPCYPNPFNPATTIRYDLHKATTVTLHVYDLRGTVVNTLVREKQHAGNYSVIWNGKDAYQRSVSAGVYLYRMQTDDGFIRTGKMLLLK